MRRLLPLAILAVAAGPLFAEDTILDRKLDNGLEVLVVEKHHAPIVTIEVAVKTGAFTEDRETNGLSHLYEHMFFKGNAAIPTQEAYMKRMQELGIKFNGTTGNERVNYFITLPSKNFAAGMQFLSDALLSPLFNKEELEKERLVVIGEYDRNESSPEYFLHVGVGKAAYGEDFIRKNPLGVRETILRATRETMTNFKNTYYVPNNSMLSIVGDVNPTQAQTLVDRFFGPTQWKQADDPHAMHPRAPMPRLEASKAVVVGREKVATPSLMAMWNGPDTDRDTKATYAGDLWGTLCGMRSGRFQRTFKDGGLATRASVGYNTQREAGEVHFGATLLKPATEVRDALLAEISAMAEDPGYWTDEELAVAKRNLHVDRAYQSQSGEALSHSLTSDWASASLDYYRTYLDETDKVTLDDVRAFVRNYVLGHPYVIGLLVQNDDPNKIDEATLLGTPPEQKGSGLASAVTSFKLSNGIRAIVRQDPGAPIAAFEVFSDGGAAYLTKETQGLERLALATALEGSKTHPRQEMRKELEKLGARLAHESGFDFSRVGVQAPADTFAPAAELLIECLKEPELSAKALKQKKIEILQGLKREKENPDAYVWRLANQVFYEGHAYDNRPEGTLETIETFDEEACRKAVARCMTPARTLVVVVSPFPAEQVKTRLEELLSWVKAPEGSEPARTELGPLAPKTRSAFGKLDTKTTYVGGKIAMPAPSDPAFPAAKILMTLLGERFWDAIRTKNALSYAPHAGISASRANFGVVYATSTNPKRTIEVMFEEMAKLKEELAPASDLKAIVTGDTTARAQRSESAAAHAQALGRAELLYGGWRRLYEETDDLAKVTPEQVRDAAKKLLVDVRWGIVGPESLDDKLLERN